MSHRALERRRRLAERYAQGATLRAIAADEGVSCNRIWQLLHAWLAYLRRPDDPKLPLRAAVRRKLTLI